MAERAAHGGLTADGIDALAKAADEQTGVVDEELIEATAGIEPDQAARLVDSYLADRASLADVNERHTAQMQARRVRRYMVPASGGDPDLAGIGIEGPDAMIDSLWVSLEAAADAAYRAAGGRERPVVDHRPLRHRRFDAAIGLLGGGGGSGGKPGPSGRPTVVVTIGLNDLIPPPTADGAESSERAPGVQLGCGPISDDLLARYATTGNLAAAIVGFDGQPLWLGRSRRHATTAQFLALVIRDRGCVRCGAHHQRCQAHHLTPWSAPAGGRTDLDDLALLCGPCHRRLHTANETLERRRTDAGAVIWKTRPATKAETPPPRPIQLE